MLAMREKAVAEIERLNARYREIDRELRKKADCSVFEDRARAAQQRYSSSSDPDDLAALILAEFVLDQARTKLHGFYRAVLVGEAVPQQFVHKFPEWRTKLAAAADLRLKKPRSNWKTSPQQNENVSATNLMTRTSNNRQSLGVLRVQFSNGNFDSNGFKPIAPKFVGHKMLRLCSVMNETFSCGESP